jgi:HSP20 family protein
MFPGTRQVFNPLFTQLQHFQHEMNRLFDRWADDRGASAFGPVTFPPVNVWEEGDGLLVQAELAGLNLNDLEIYVSGSNQLTIKGERKPVAPEKALQHRQERIFGKFSRTLTLPFAVDATKVEARLENGVLHIKLAKHESAKPRKIQVKGE